MSTTTSDDEQVQQLIDYVKASNPQGEQQVFQETESDDSSAAGQKFFKINISFKNNDPSPNYYSYHLAVLSKLLGLNYHAAGFGQSSVRPGTFGAYLHFYRGWSFDKLIGLRNIEFTWTKGPLPKFWLCHVFLTPSGEKVLTFGGFSFQDLPSTTGKLFWWKTNTFSPN